MSTLERITPRDLAKGETTGSDTLVIHLARYDFAAHYVRPGRLLDIACGVGYGTYLMASHHPEAWCVGVDIAASAIAAAQDAYSHPRVEYVQADATSFVDSEGFDTIVSLETIEHMQDPQEFVDHIVSLLRPGGRLVGSVPSTPSVDANPHHTHDFTEKTFRALFRPHGLREIGCLRVVQPYAPLPVLTRREQRAADVRPNLIGYYVSHPWSLVRRLAATARYGFENRYVTIAFERPT